MNKSDWSKWNSKDDNFKKYSKIQSRLIYGTPSETAGYVSIVILTFKRAHGLKNSLDSALNQDYSQPYTIAVLDDSGYDAATDKLMQEYCSKFKNILYYRHEKNLGQYANWNRACELAPTEWYCLLHDDDILKVNYLKELTKYTDERNDLGLIGVYIDVNDTRESYNPGKKSLPRIALDVLIKAFLTLRSGKVTLLSLSDNIRHIYVMNSTFINKRRAMEIGGLDDSYFPSSDFAFSAKMAFYYKTAFLPLKLTNKGVGDSESLKQSVCDDSIRCAFFQTKAMCQTLGYSEKKQIRAASIAAVISEIGVKGYNNVDYGHIKQGLGMKAMYNHKFIIILINIYSKFNWGTLLFRSSTLR